MPLRASENFRFGGAKSPNPRKNRALRAPRRLPWPGNVGSLPLTTGKWRPRQNDVLDTRPCEPRHDQDPRCLPRLREHLTKNPDQDLESCESRLSDTLRRGFLLVQELLPVEDLLPLAAVFAATRRRTLRRTALETGGHERRRKKSGLAIVAAVQRRGNLISPCKCREADLLAEIWLLFLHIGPGAAWGVKPKERSLPDAVIASRVL